MDNQAWKTGEPIIAGGPQWLTLSFVLIAVGVLIALLILAWGTRLAKRRQNTREALEERGEVQEVPASAPLAPPVAPSPPPLADSIAPETMPARATLPEATGSAGDEAPEAAPLSDEPVAAAAPMEASPASLAASDPAPADTGSTGADTLTRMKGVGPKLAERLNAAGITRFDQLAALTPEEAEALDAQMGDFRGRIHRDRWIEQARFLAVGDTAGYEATFGRL